MELRPGLRLESTTSEAQVVVVKAPAGDVDLRCGGQPVAEIDSGAARTEPTGEGETLLGKRYASEELGIELLCTKAGAGALSVGDVPLDLKGAKPLPSSD